MRQKAMQATTAQAWRVAKRKPSAPVLPYAKAAAMIYGVQKFYNSVVNRWW